MILKDRSKLTQQLLHEYLDYDPLTGHLTWRKKLSIKTVVGRRAGCKVSKRDNRIIKIFGLVILEHRLIWLYIYGYYPKRDQHIDHINHIEDDNRQINLRLTTQAENNRNSSLRSDNTSGRVGVSISKTSGNKKFVAEIYDMNNTRHRKNFYTLEEAIAQRVEWEVLFNYHINHGIKKPS